jgi:hypothetical protein
LSETNQVRELLATYKKLVRACEVLRDDVKHPEALETLR